MSTEARRPPVPPLDGDGADAPRGAAPRPPAPGTSAAPPASRQTDLPPPAAPV
ncbi:hypothetical protein SZN_27706, partial [Streptomyces zinciresistens K42]